MTLQTLVFLRDMVLRQQISADTENLVELATLVKTVRDELDQAIREANLELPNSK